MSKLLTSIAAAALLGVAALPMQASAAEKQTGVTTQQSTELSSQRRHFRGHRHYGYRHGYRNYAYRPYYGPRYYADPYPYYRPYGYYRPGITFGLGPFGFGVF